MWLKSVNQNKMALKEKLKIDMKITDETVYKDIFRFIRHFKYRKEF